MQRDQKPDEQLVDDQRDTLLREDQLDGRSEDQLSDRQRDPNEAARDDSQLSTEDLVAATDRSQDRDRMDEAAPRDTDDDESPVHLFEPAEAERFRMEWQEVQTRFVDDPKDAVQGADHLVAQVLQSLATSFTDRKHELEGHWQSDSEVQTEDLRIALRRYRSFFNQLLDA